MNYPHRRVDTKRTLEGVPSIDVRDVRLGNIGTIQEHIHRSGQQMVITSILHCALFKVVNNGTSCVRNRVSHLEVSNGGFSRGCNMRHGGFQRKTGHKNLMRLSIRRDGSLPLDGVSDRQGALANNTSGRGNALLHLHLWDRGRTRDGGGSCPRNPAIHWLEFRNGLDGETLGRRNSSIENISGRGAEDKIRVIPDFTSRLTQGDAILEGDRGRRLPII